MSYDTGAREFQLCWFDQVKAPTLLIVGGNDTTVLEMNSAASRLLKCTRQLEVIPGATHLFEEPGTLEAVASAAGAWFQQHLTFNAD